MGTSKGNGQDSHIAQKTGDNFTMSDLHRSLSSSGDTIMESERKIAEYLSRWGILAENKIANLDKAAATQNLRKENYHNVKSLLQRYRCLRRQCGLFKDFLIADVFDAYKVDTSQFSSSRNVFEALSTQLELLESREEKKFQSQYAPQIATGRRLEAALNAVDWGLRMLQAESQRLYDVLYVTYIEGEKEPTKHEILAKLKSDSMSTLYAQLKRAEERLSTLIFGFASNKQELFSLLLYLRQEEADPFFPYE